MRMSGERAVCLPNLLVVPGSDAMQLRHSDLWRALCIVKVRLRTYTSLYSVWVTASQLDLPSLTPLSVAGCIRLQLLADHWVTSVALLQVVDNRHHTDVAVDSPLGTRGRSRLYLYFL